MMVAYFWQSKEGLSYGNHIFHLTHWFDALFHNTRMFSTSIIENLFDAIDMPLSPLAIRFANDLQGYKGRKENMFNGKKSIVKKRVDIHLAKVCKHNQRGD